MTLTRVEFEAILNDVSKQIQGDIAWQEDEDHSPRVEFRAEVSSDAGWPLFVIGTYNPLLPAVSFAIILQTEGRIYALDLGKDHHNPQCHRIGEKHKHRWSETYRDKEAYVPDDITADASEPVIIWEQFCSEAKITHQGKMIKPQTTGSLFYE